MGLDFESPRLGWERVQAARCDLLLQGQTYPRSACLKWLARDKSRSSGMNECSELTEMTVDLHDCSSHSNHCLTCDKICELRS